MRPHTKANQRFLFAAIVLCLLLVFGVAGTMAESTPKECDIIKLGINTDVTGVDPHTSAAVVNAIVLGHMFEPLVAYGNRLEILPVLAESWEVSPDLQTYTFKLRKGRKFHNGREMVADDVKYSIRRILDPKTKNPRAKSLSIITGIETPDKYTVVFKLNKPSAGFLDLLAYISPVIAIVPKEVVEAQGGEMTKPVGTGPYKFVAWEPDRYILMERFDDYQPLPGPRNGQAGAKIAYAKQIKFVPIGEESAAVMALLNKEIDILQYYPAKLFKRYQENYKDQGLGLQELTGISWYQIFFGMDQPVTKNLNFRKACALAIDLGRVTQTAFMGHAKVNPSFVPTLSQYHTPAHDKWYKKDVAKAKELLKESGYKGEPVYIDCTKKYAAMYRQAVAVQSELEAIGVNAKLRVLEWPILLSKFYKGNYQILSFGIGGRPNPTLAYNMLRRNKFTEAFPRMEEIILTASKTLDVEKRKKLFEEAHLLNMDKVGSINFYNYNYLQAYQNYIHGYEVINTGYPRLWGVWRD